METMTTLEMLLEDARARGWETGPGAPLRVWLELLASTQRRADGVAPNHSFRSLKELGEERKRDCEKGEREMMKVRRLLNITVGAGLDGIGYSLGLPRVGSESDSFFRDRLQRYCERFPQATTWCDACDRFFIDVGDGCTLCKNEASNWRAKAQNVTYTLARALRDTLVVAPEKPAEMLDEKRPSGYKFRLERSPGAQRLDVVAIKNSFKTDIFQACLAQFLQHGQNGNGGNRAMSDARPDDPAWECDRCGTAMPRCRIKNCVGTIARVMPHEIVPRQTSEQWLRAADVLCTHHALEKLKLESGLGILKRHALESVTRPAKLEQEPIACDVGADWED